MHLTTDMLLPWQALFKPLSVSRARVYQDFFQSVLILSEVPDSGGELLINGIDVAVAQAIENFQLVPTRLVCIEHLPAGYFSDWAEEVFNLVWFTYNPQTRTLEKPRRFRLDLSEVIEILAGSTRTIQQLQRSLSEHPPVSGE
jgi:hypothetical protein